MKIAIVQLGRIGDLVLVTSAVNIIKNKYPNAEIDFIVGKSNEIVIRNNPNISRILVFDKNPVKLISFILKLKNKLYDFYIDPKDHYSTESTILACLVNAVIKVGFNNKKNKKNIFDISIPSDKENANLHFIERIENIFKLIDINTNIKPLIPNLFILQTSKSYVQNYLEQNEIKKYIIINISASNIDKMWIEDKWVHFINIIKNQTDSQIVLTSESKHLQQAKNIIEKTKIKHFTPTTLPNVMALISTATLLISVDTSLIHIASTFDIPVIALTNNVPWSAIKFEPLSTKKIVILPKKNNSFIKDITTEQLTAAYDSISKIVFK